MKTFKIAAAVAASLLSVTAIPAAAENVSVAVSIADLDLSTPAGTQALAQRIDAGAKEVCGRPNVRDLKSGVAFAECREAAVAGAVEQLKSVGVAEEAIALN